MSQSHIPIQQTWLWQPQALSHLVGPRGFPGAEHGHQKGIKARADSREQGEQGKVEEEKELDGGPRMICTSQLVGSRVLGLTSMITRRLGDGEGKGKGEHS